jgi:Flp pilus assembly protein TadB
MRQPIGATDTTAEGERVGTYASRQAAEQAVGMLAADPDLTSVWIQVSKLDRPDRDAQQRSGPERIVRRDLAAAFGVGTLLGSSFLVLTLIGLPVLGWAVLGLVLVWALIDIIVVAVGASRPIPFGSWPERSGDQGHLT